MVSASEKLKALDDSLKQDRPDNDDAFALRNALPQIVAVVEAGQSMYLGFTCPQDPMDCDERLERFAAALAALDEALT